MLCKETFANPPSEFRPIPFWFWNSKLRKPEIEAQIRDFHAKGIGGFFVHARFGLETEYLSDEWMDCIRHAVAIASELGMEVWLYDENGFPSGVGDLKVSRVREFRSKFVELVEGESPESAVFRFSVLEDPNDVIFGVDYLNPDAMRAFFDITFKPYEEALSEHFGKTIKGIFTDEPTLLPWHHNISWYGQRKDTKVVVWDERIEGEMQSRVGMGRNEFLPHLFFDVDGRTPDIRRAFWASVRDLYVRAFFAPYREWCDKHNMKFTGHVLFEEGLYINTDFQSDITALLEHMHIPGTDHLGEVTEVPYGGFANTVPHLTNLQGEKLVASLAHWAGKEAVISETYGCAGWSLSFEKMKWMADWQYSLGINMLCPHAVFYSIEGFRKSDAPPSENHMTGWPHYRAFADYIGRLSYVVRRGTHVAKVALFYPLRQFWGLHTIGEVGAQDKAMSDAFDLCASMLCKLHFDYDIISEQALAGASIGDGKLVIGKETYDVLIAHPAALMDKASEVAKRIAHRIEPPPAFTDDDRAQFSNRLDNALRELIQPDVEITTVDGQPLPDVRYVHRRDGSQHFYFVANTSGTAVEARISTEAAGFTETWNPETGEVSETAGVETRNGRQSVTLSLPPCGSTVLVIDESRAANLTPMVVRERTELLVLPDEWDFSLEGPNTLPLRDLVFTPVVNSAGTNYHYRAAFDCEFVPQSLLLMLDDIEYRSSLMGGMDISICVNERIWGQPDFGHYLDKGFKTLDIAEAVRPGPNEIRIEIRHSAWSGQPHILNSPPVLLGNFACDQEANTLRPPIRKAAPGSWTDFGYPFFSGTATYEQEFALPPTPSPGRGELNTPSPLARGELDTPSPLGGRAGERGKRVIVSVDDVRDMVEIEVNGRSAAVRLWHPWEADITDLLVAGENRLRLKITNSMLNFLEATPRESGLMGRVRLIAEG